MYDVIDKKQKSAKTYSHPKPRNYQPSRQSRPSRNFRREGIDWGRGLGYTPEEVEAMRNVSPFLGRELDVPENLSERIQDSFGINSNEISLLESPDVATMGARATAQGNVIRFAPGEYRPDTVAGLEIIGHELNHVREQAEGNVSANVEGTNFHIDPIHESSSDSVGYAFASGTLSDASPISVASADGAVIQGYNLEIPDIEAMQESLNNPNVMVAGREINNVHNIYGESFTGLREMIYALEGLDGYTNAALPPEEQRVIWDEYNRQAIIRMTNRETGELTENQYFNIDDRGKENGFLVRDDRIIINNDRLSELAGIAGLEDFLDIDYDENGNQRINLLDRPNNEGELIPDPGAQTLDTLPQELASTSEERRLPGIPGVGHLVEMWTHLGELFGDSQARLRYRDGGYVDARHEWLNYGVSQGLDIAGRVLEATPPRTNPVPQIVDAGGNPISSTGTPPRTNPVPQIVDVRGNPISSTGTPPRTNPVPQIVDAGGNPTSSTGTPPRTNPVPQIVDAGGNPISSTGTPPRTNPVPQIVDARGNPTSSTGTPPRTNPVPQIVDARGNPTSSTGTPPRTNPVPQIVDARGNPISNAGTPSHVSAGRALRRGGNVLGKISTAMDVAEIFNSVTQDVRAGYGISADTVETSFGIGGALAAGAAGARLGAMVGSIVPGKGTLVGAAVGGAIGLVGGMAGAALGRWGGRRMANELMGGDDAINARETGWLRRRGRNN